MGSGGGSAASALGGAGGGALRLVVDDTLILNGALSANGLAGTGGDSHAGGGGAGGSLWIEASTFSGNGMVRANGGDGGEIRSPTGILGRCDNAYGQGGGGAGGRVAIYASHNAFTSSGGTISASGGSGYEDGEAGSVYVSVTATSLATMTAGFAAIPTSGSAPLTVTFTNLSTSSDGTCGGYQWSFGDGLTSTLENPIHVYTRTGSFTVTLTATNGNENDVKVKNDYILVTTENPVTVTADFAATPISGDVPLTVTFINLSTASDAVQSYQWNFGDGEISVLENPTHVYAQAGSFTVSLTITTGNESDSEVKADYITIHTPLEPELMTRIITYTYDGLHRLTGADYSTGESFTHFYDAAGNRTRMTSTTPLSGTVVTIHTYDAANRLTGRLARYPVAVYPGWLRLTLT